MQRIARIHFLSSPEQLRPVRDAVRQLAVEQGCSDKNLDCLVMAINEACMNVIQHGYANRNDGEMILEFWRDQDLLSIRLFDFAEPVDKASIKSRDLDDIKPGGLGVHIMQQVMDSVAYQHGPDGVGNMLEMRKRLSDETICCPNDYQENNDT